MKKALLLAIVLFFITIFSFSMLSAQNPIDSTIIMYNRFTGFSFEQNQQKICRADVYDMLSTNELSNLFIYKASLNESLSMLFGFGGGFLIAYPLGQQLSHKEPNWEFAGGGILMLLVAAHLNGAYKNNIALAVSVYNQKFSNKTASRLKIEVGFNPAGAGVCMRF